MSKTDQPNADLPSQSAMPNERPAAHCAPPGQLDFMTLLGVTVVLACAVGVIYGGAIHSPLIYDDASTVTLNRSIVRLFPLLGDNANPGPLTPPKDFVTSGRPLVNLTFALNYRFGQLDTTGYHIVNLLIHVLNASLLFAVVRNGLRSTYCAHRYDSVAIGLSFAIALVWAVHPLQTDAVEYISQRTELMVAFFYLSTLFACQRYFAAATTPSRRAWLTVATMACALGAGCKEVMVTAPVLILLYDRTFESGSFRQAFDRNWPLYAGLTLSWGVIFALNISGPRSDTAGFHHQLNALTWWLTQTKVLAIYFRLVVWPWPLIIHRHVPYISTYFQAIPWVTAAGAFGLFVLYRLWKGTALGYLGAWVLIILSPTLVVPIITEVAAERRLYLPLAAFVTLGVTALYELVVRVQAAQSPAHVAVEGAATNAEHVEASTGDDATPQKSSGLSPLAITISCAACLALVLAGVSRVRMEAYRDELAIFQDAVDHQPDDPICTYTLALDLQQAGRAKEAIPHFRRSIELRKGSAPPKIDKYLGLALTETGAYDEAIERLQRAVAEEPDNLALRRSYGVALINGGRQSDAILQFERLTQAQPSAEDFDYLGAALINANRAGEAVDRLQTALRLKPELFLARFKLALAYAKLGKTEEAIAAAQQALDQANQQRADEAAAQIRSVLNSLRAAPSTTKPGS